MKIGRPKLVHLAHRVPAVVRAHEPAAEPRDFTIIAARSAPPEPPAKVNAISVPWREIPHWHSVPGDPVATLTRSARAYAQAATLTARPLHGRLANELA